MAMAKISESTIPLDRYRPGIADYRPPISRRAGNYFTRFGRPLAPESIAGNRYLCAFDVDCSSGKNVLRITIPNSKTSIGLEMVPRHNEETGKTLPCAIFFRLTEKGPQEFQFPPDRMLLVRACEADMVLVLGILNRPDLEMHAALRESLSRLTRGEAGSAFICKKGIFVHDKISKVEIFG